jgi:hypothetical protein
MEVVLLTALTAVQIVNICFLGYRIFLKTKKAGKKEDKNA